METRVGSDAHLLYRLDSGELRTVGKRSLEWDLNDWKWDGDLFIASPFSSDPSNCKSNHFFPSGSGVPVTGGSSNTSSSCSDEVNLEIDKRSRDLEKRRRVVVVEDDNVEDEGRGPLSVKFGGGNGNPMTEREVGNWDRTSGKKTKVMGNVSNSNRAICQVHDCAADLSIAKDYHRRHKVCEMHSKVSEALVANMLQRFCQQCSRFHALKEFDEGKRSCRRRLAGHNKRRRKTQPNAIANNSSLNGDQATGYLLISLLRILSNMQSNISNQTNDHALLSHLLRSIANHGGLHGDRNIYGLLQESQNLLNNGPTVGNSETISGLLLNGPQCLPRPDQHHPKVPDEIPRKGGYANDARCRDVQNTVLKEPAILFCNKDGPSIQADARDSCAGRSKLNNFDLNDVYIDSDECIEDYERSPAAMVLGTDSMECPSWVKQDSHQSSPPQTSGNSDSASAQSPSSSSGDTQSRTDRIVFKLFGKEPKDLPFVLRTQILDWLSHSPNDIESYIRPGCIILTIYLSQSESAWEELCCDLTSSLSRLLSLSDDYFWTTGWVYVRVQHQIAFIYNGQVVLDTSLPFRSNAYSIISSVKPIAITASDRVQFSVKGYNLTRPSMRLLCALEGNYLVQGTTHSLVEVAGGPRENDGLQSLDFFCSVPDVSGRGFIEVEDLGLSSSFFPFIVADKDVCTEIRMLESAIDLPEADDDDDVLLGDDARNRAMGFIHEMGWLLRRNQLKSRLVLFPLKRFMWLVDFSMDHNWCAVVKKLLDILLDGTVSGGGGGGEYPVLKLALSEMSLLHRAVRKNSRSLVELLLTYCPEKISDGLKSEYESLVVGNGKYLFRPDVVGPAGLTPLHVAAGIDGAETLLDALTDDPGKVGIEAWKSACDNAGFTPEDYARLRGHYTYIHLVQKKINRSPTPVASTGHVVVNIPGVVIKQNKEETTSITSSSSTFDVVQVNRGRESSTCKRCSSKMKGGYYGNGRKAMLLYRPAMLSMVGIAAVCVCVALLFKSSPQVLYIFRPFRWELLDFGSS